MVNAWSLAASVIDGTLDEDYPMYGPEDERALVERNKKKFPATDDITGILEYPEDDPCYGYEYTPLSSMTTAEANLHIHATSSYNDGWTQQAAREELAKMRSDSERKTDNRYKYHETEIIKDIEEYVSSTYNGHYTGDTHEYRNVQTIDLMAARSLASGFCQSNILKYGSRYGSKNGKNKKDLMKVIHYAMLLLHFDEHYGKPSITSGNIDHNMP